MSEANPTDGRPADGSGARLHTGSSTWGFAIPYLSAALVLVGLSVARVGSVSFAPANQAPVSQASAATLVYTDNALSIGPPKATPLLKGFRSGDRIRLGDVVSTDVPNVMIAALWDDRFTIVPPVAASPVPPNEARCAISVGDPFFVRVGMPSNPPPDVVQKNLPQKEFENLPEALPPPNKAALPNEPGIPEQKAPRYENPTGQPLSEREKGTLFGATSPFRIIRSTQQIATSAIMVALLKADAEGASSLSLGSFRFSPSGSDPKQDMVTLDTAGADAVSRVWHHLGSVRMVYVESPAPATFPSNLVAALASYLTTSLPFPGGAAFLEPKIIDSASVSANPANLFNPAFSVEEPITRLPAITFITLSVLGFLLGRRRQTTDEARMDPRAAGAVSVAMLLVLMILTRDLWRQVPGIWIATTPGLLFCAVALNLAEVWMRAAVRSGTSAREAETRRDNALRSVLYRDTPIDNVADDRLGFQVLVGALRRFLDNPDTVPPVVVSINGPWGSGKSSIMKMLVRELEKTTRFQTIWFNAWQYHEETNILPAFLRTLGRKLSADRKLGFSLRLAWARVKPFTFFQFLIIAIAPTLIVVGIWILASRPLFEHPDQIWNSMAGGENLGKAITALITLAGSLVGVALGVWTAVNAFRLRFVRLFALVDQSRGALIDDFTNEFQLYREAVGSGKFLFVVDDLDRCPPDRVVAVLKAINLIVTSSDENNRSFFVLGFDSDYIVRSIEQYFRSLAPEGFEHQDHFGQEYLKKMVTLSVSVPKPRPERMRDLLAKLDSDSAGEPPRPSQPAQSLRLRIRDQIQAIPAWGWRLGAAAICAGGIAIGIVASLSPHSSGRPTVETTSGNVTVAPAGNVTEIVMPKIAETPGPAKWWLWGIPGGMILLMGGLLVRGLRQPVVERSYLREARDSEEFRQAIDRCTDLLPSNPRDLVRTINLMRMEYLLQSSHQAPFSGKPLTEWECVSYTLLQQRHPQVFDPEALEEKVIPGLRTLQREQLRSPSSSPPAPENFYSKIAAGPEDEPQHVSRDVEKLGTRSDNGRDRTLLAHLTDPDKLQRFADLNRYSIGGGYRPDWNWQAAGTAPDGAQSSKA